MVNVICKQKLMSTYLLGQSRKSGKNKLQKAWKKGRKKVLKALVLLLEKDQGLSWIPNDSHSTFIWLLKGEQEGNTTAKEGFEKINGWWPFGLRSCYRYPSLANDSCLFSHSQQKSSQISFESSRLKEELNKYVL